MMPLLTTDAITLKTYELGDVDKIVVLFTAKEGKIRVVAKGARKIKSTFAAAIEPFTYNQVVVYQGKSDLGKLSQCDIKESFTQIKKDMEKMSYAFYITELIDFLTTDNSKEESVFKLFILTLRLLDRLDDNKLVTRAFEFKLLNLLGYRPNLAGCIKCEQAGGNYFDFQAGGLVCKSCKGRFNRKLSQSSIKYIEQLLKIEYQNLDRLVIPDYVNQELIDLIPAYVEFLTNKQLKSSAFIELLAD